MKFLLILIAIIYSIDVDSQNVSYYKYGQNGIEIIYKPKDSTFIYSNFNAIMQIRSEVGKEIVSKYRHFKEGDHVIELKLPGYRVLGKLTIMRKVKVVLLNFYYDRVIWENGEINIYRK